jgi:hypothetical protein
MIGIEFEQQVLNQKKWQSHSLCQPGVRKSFLVSPADRTIRLGFVAIG